MTQLSVHFWKHFAPGGEKVGPFQNFHISWGSKTSPLWWQRWLCLVETLLGWRPPSCLSWDLSLAGEGETETKNSKSFQTSLGKCSFVAVCREGGNYLFTSLTLNLGAFNQDTHAYNVKTGWNSMRRKGWSTYQEDRDTKMWDVRNRLEKEDCRFLCLRDFPKKNRS